jgi:hypothetical protein
MMRTPNAGSNVLALPFADALSPTSCSLPGDLTADQWLEIGRALGRARGSMMWWSVIGGPMASTATASAPT